MVSAIAINPYAVEKRPLGVAGSIALVVAVSALGIRAVETASDPAGFVRVAVSAIAIGAFFAVRRYSFFKGVLLALAIELVAGTTMFVTVDVPLLRAMQPRITQATISVMRHLARRSAPPIATLTQR